MERLETLQPVLPLLNGIHLLNREIQLHRGTCSFLVGERLGVDIPGPRWLIRKHTHTKWRNSHNVQFETGVRIRATPTAISTTLALNFLIILTITRKRNTIVNVIERNIKFMYTGHTSSLLIHKDERWPCPAQLVCGETRSPVPCRLMLKRPCGQLAVL